MKKHSRAWEQEIFSGCGLIARLLLFYARVFPEHPCKGRFWRFLTGFACPKGLLVRNGHGDKLLIDPNNYIGKVICRRGCYEPMSISLARKLVRGGVMVDIGCNFGLYTCTVGRHDQTKVVAVDASAIPFVELIKNISINGMVDVVAFNGALDATHGIVDLYTPVSNVSAARIEATPNHSGFRHCVPALPIDLILEKYSNGRVKLMKIDVEGHEFCILSHMNFNAAWRPEHILMEHLEQGGCTGADLKRTYDLLRSCDYEAFNVQGDPYVEGMELPESNIWWRSTRGD